MLRKYGWIAVLAIVLDRITKIWAAGMTGPAVLIPGVIGLRFVKNTGMAFSMLSGQTWLLVLLSSALLALGSFILSRGKHGALTSVAAMMILGGALGNMYDRIFIGYVTDMIEVLAFRFAVFNAADSFLTAGCCLMALSLLIKPEEWSENKHGRADH